MMCLILVKYRIQVQHRRRQRAEEQESSTSATCSVIQSEGEAQEEEAEAATPTSAEAEQEVEETCPVEAAGDAAEQPDAGDPGSEVFVLHLHLLDEGLDLPASGWADCPSSPVVSTRHVLLHPSSLSPTWTHPLVPPPQCVLHPLQDQYTSPTLQSHM